MVVVSNHILPQAGFIWESEQPVVPSSNPCHSIIEIPHSPILFSSHPLPRSHWASKQICITTPYRLLHIPYKQFLVNLEGTTYDLSHISAEDSLKVGLNVIRRNNHEVTRTKDGKTLARFIGTQLPHAANVYRTDLRRVSKPGIALRNRDTHYRRRPGKTETLAETREIKHGAKPRGANRHAGAPHR